MKKNFLWISSIHFGGRIFISKDLVLIAWRYIVIPNVIRTDIGSKFLILNLLFGGISGLPRQGTRNHVISESQAARMTALTLGGLVNDWTGSTFYLRAARFLCPEVQWSVYTLEVDLFSSVWFTRLRLEPFSISDRSLEVCVSCFDDFKHVMFCLHRSLMIWWMWNERAIDSDWFHLYIIIHASMVQVCSSLTLRQSSVTKGWVSDLGLHWIFHSCLSEVNKWLYKHKKVLVELIMIKTVSSAVTSSLPGKSFRSTRCVTSSERPWILPPVTKHRAKDRIFLVFWKNKVCLGLCLAGEKKIC